MTTRSHRAAKSKSDSAPIDLRRPNLIQLAPIVRPKGYSLPNTHIAAAQLRLGSIDLIGHGEDQDMAIAQAKAESEAIERFAMFQSMNYGIAATSSNGWACHFNSEKAIEAATSEIIERDVAITAWENLGPYLRIPKDLWPEPVLKWDLSKAFEYSKLEILQSISENGASVTALLLNARGNFVSGHASGTDLRQSILSAMQECLRAAQLSLRFAYFAEVQRLHSTTDREQHQFEPGIHGLAYAYQEILPLEIKFENATSISILSNWRDHQATLFKHISNARVHLFELSPSIVAYVKCDGIKEMRWGSARLDQQTENKRPHIVG
jgi:hypothetical protein